MYGAAIVAGPGRPGRWQHMAGKLNLDQQKTQAEEIAQLKDDYLACYAALPVEKLAADVIGRSPDTIQDWMKADAEFAARCS
jgi:hypothetical protein